MKKASNVSWMAIRFHAPLLAGIALSSLIIFFLMGRGGMTGAIEEKKEMNPTYNPLTPDEEYVILRKGTERPFTGKYYASREAGYYTCRRCDAVLFHSRDKFDSGCGWPSFDDEIPGAVRRQKDADGMRIEIVCNHCGGHLGHVFQGEGLTAKNTRHCVNSISLDFIPEAKAQRAIFAAGCFWGVEYHFQKARGVLAVSAGYTGGHTQSPTYREVCDGDTGHAEAVEVIWNPDKISYEDLAKLFFETHDPTQVNRQGPDVGDQYRSEIFWLDESQKQTAQKLIELLTARGMKIATRVSPAARFWPAEDYHQDYYQKKNGSPYCHVYTKRF